MTKRPQLVMEDTHIISSGLLDLKKFLERWTTVEKRPIWVNAYRKTGPAKGQPPPLSRDADLKGTPTGILAFFEYGIGFLAAKRKRGGEVATTIGRKLASRVIPFGGLLVAGAARAASAARSKKVTDKEMDDILENPNTFFIPYWKISRILVDQVGGFMSKRRYLIIESEEDGTQETFFINYQEASRADLEAFSDFIWALKPWSLVKPMRIAEVREIVDLAAIESDESLGGDPSKMMEALFRELASHGRRWMDIPMDLIYEYQDLFYRETYEGAGKSICWNVRCRNQEQVDVGRRCPSCESYILSLDSEGRDAVKVLKDPNHWIQNPASTFPLYFMKVAASSGEWAEAQIQHGLKAVIMREAEGEEGVTALLYRDLFDYVGEESISGFSPTFHRDIQHAVRDGFVEADPGDPQGYRITEKLRSMKFDSFE